MEKINDLQAGIENNLRIYQENIYKKDIDGAIYAHDWKARGGELETLGGLTIDIKERINGLSAEDAKVALFDTVSRLGVLLFQLRYSWASDSFGESAEDCANEVLDEALEESRK